MPAGFKYSVICFVFLKRDSLYLKFLLWCNKLSISIGAVVVGIQSLARELSYAMGVAIKKRKRERVRERDSLSLKRLSKLPTFKIKFAHDFSGQELGRWC